MTIDLHQYAARIGYGGGWRQDLETLRNVHFGHATSIPFENLDVLLGRPIRLDLESLWAKLVLGGRGGYCFEQNALLAAVLEEAGYRVTRLAARVRMGATGVRPRSHMLLAVEAEGEEWIADVGFGGMGLLRSIRLVEGVEDECLGWRHRLVREGAMWVLQASGKDGWIDQYAFTLEPQYPVDYEVSNHFTSTYPESIFRKMLMVQKAGECRLLVQNRRLIEQRPEGSTEVVVAGDEGLREVLGTRFGLWVPEGTRFGVD